LQFLSEDTIKRATLSFMKTYYKFRPRRGETVISYDRAHASGVIVDGHLEFPKEDGSLFVATFEATSAATSEEVRYSLQRQQLLWDAFAAASVGTVVVMLVLWIYNLWSLNQSGWLFSLSLPLTLIFLAVIAYHMFFRSAGRYRYIYAIEQFKQYHADEQWVAVGFDVFNEGSDPNFMELKNQCVENGFGLVIVDKDEHVNLLITPAREEVFGKKRRSLKFMENPSLKNLRNFSPTNLGRYQRPYMAQALTCLVSLGVLSGVFYRQWQVRPIETVSSTSHYQEQLEGMVDSLHPDIPKTIYKKEDAAKVEANVLPYSGSTNEAISSTVSNKTQVGLYVYTPTDGYLSYDCARAGMRGTKYVVQDILYKSFDEARKRIDQLKTYGLIANCISLSCTESASQGYCVYYELMYNNEANAQSKANQIKKELDDLHLPNDFIKIRVLKF
jgi:uncharacterized membrane protein